MPLGLFQTSRDITIAAVDRLLSDAAPRIQVRPDATINPGTLCLFDVASQYGRPSASALVQNTQLANLVEGGAPALVMPIQTVSGITYRAGGVEFLLSSGSFYGYIELPTITPVVGLMRTVWFRSSDAGDNGFNSRLMGLAGLFYVAITISDGVRPTTYEVVTANASDRTVQNPDVLAALYDTDLHQLAHYLEPRPGGKYRVVTFLDRVRVYEGAEYTFATQASPTMSYFGNEGDQTITGRWYRDRVDLVPNALMTADDIIAADYDANYARLAALPPIGTANLLDLNFVDGWYAKSSAYGADLTALSGLTYSRPGAGATNWLADQQAEPPALATYAANQARLLPGEGLIVEESKTNRFLNSLAPVTQTITLPTGAYTVGAWGPGQVVIAAGTATVSNGGVVTAGRPRTITCTVSGTISVTVTGSPFAVQVEEGAQSTSLIVTSGAAVTRAADVLTLTGMSALASAPFVLTAMARMPSALTASQPLAELNDGTASNRLRLYRPSSGEASLVNSSAGASTFVTGVTGKASARTLRMAVRRRTGGLATAVDGVLGGTSTATPGPVDSIQIGGASGPVYLNGVVQSVRLAPGDMTDLQLRDASALPAL